MVSAIDGSQAGWTPSLDSDDDEVRLRAPAASTTKVATAPPELPQGPDRNGALLVRAAQALAGAAAPTPRPLLALGIAAAAVTPDQDTAVQKRLDAFFQSAVPTYKLPAEGGKAAVSVAVATPFQMASKTAMRPGETDESTRRFVAHENRVLETDKELKVIGAALGMTAESVNAVKGGRGTPEQVQALTQALIDHGKLPPAGHGEPTEARVRRMMCDYGIGFDCAGFTQQALLAAHGITRAQAGLNPQMINESLSNLSSAHFSKVSPEDARAGDVIALGPPQDENVGHRLIVYDRHEASPAEIERYCSNGAGAALAMRPVTVLTVDSSFGSSGFPAWGGVQRQTWLYDGKKWGAVFPPELDSLGKVMVPERVKVHDLPYDGRHPLIGVYHHRGTT